MVLSKGRHILKFTVQAAGIALLLFINFLIERQAAARLADGVTHVFIKGVLGFHYAENTGAAFSLFSSSTDILSVFTGILLFAGLVYLAIPLKKRTLMYEICIPLIIAGGAGNLIDRLKMGYVIDYIRTLFIDFPIFNFADCLITCSAIALCVYVIYEMIAETRDKKHGIAVKELKPDGESDD